MPKPKYNEKVIDAVLDILDDGKKHYLSRIQAKIDSMKLWNSSEKTWADRRVGNQLGAYSMIEYPDGGCPVTREIKYHDIVGDDGETYYDQLDFLVFLTD